MKKISLFIILALATGALSVYALTSHSDYKGMAIKDCNSCHASSGVPSNHISMWAKEHRLYAEKRPNNCKDCHDQAFCLDCHKGGGIDRDLHVSTSGVDYMPRSHRTDWREIHPIKAIAEPDSCYRCHDSKRFCSECHKKFNPADLRVLSHRKGWSDLEAGSGGPMHSTFTTAQCPTCHPNSLLPKHQWSSEHAREARKNLSSCQSCHPEGDVCLKCHSAKSGLMVNPHPRNWKKISGRLSDAGNRRSCVKCH